MNPQQHVVQGAPRAFAKAINELVAKRDLALSIGPISHADGILAAVVTESQRSPGTSGSLASITVHQGKDPNGFFAECREVNPTSTIEGVFPVPAGEKGKPASIIVVSTHQP